MCIGCALHVSTQLINMGNASSAKEFIPMSLSQKQGVQKVYSVILLFFYTSSVAGNIVTVMSSQHLNSPMYFFLCYLVFPKMIADFLVKNKTISFVGCMIVIFIMMAYGCYTANCGPFHCTTLMTQSACGCMVISSWVGGFVHCSMQTLLITLLPFCGPNKVDHYFCDVHPLLQLACQSHFFILVVSYVVILVSLRSHTSEGRRKALSTCGSHITVVVLFFGPCTFTHPTSSLPEDKVLALSVVAGASTPAVNPLIYSTRNQEFKDVVRKLLGKH
uniref:G-protein coupled receptors family 1 profile domain-containing protein n=1 Tax=Coturnix japonica TaxID=93934 RepID=A0A8C2YC90_COTJA